MRVELLLGEKSANVSECCRRRARQEIFVLEYGKHSKHKLSDTTQLFRARDRLLLEPDLVRNNNKLTGLREGLRQKLYFSVGIIVPLL